MQESDGWQSSPDRAAAIASLKESIDFVPADEPPPVPALTFTDAEGTALSLADFRGRVVLLNLWATWCAPCIEEMPALDALERELGSPGFAVIALSQDQGGMNAVAPFWEKAGLEHLAIYLDKTMTGGRAIQARGLPTTLLIDPEGRELGRIEGPAKWDQPVVVAALRSLANKDTKPGD
ncbi:MAG: hypothetical protein CMM50_01485 [Rhodospirillaceae bacterium]|nr:hypothetical protein [Rhodospirillaceae bacterium]